VRATGKALNLGFSGEGFVGDAGVLIASIYLSIYIHVQGLVVRVYGGVRV